LAQYFQISKSPAKSSTLLLFIEAKSPLFRRLRVLFPLLRVYQVKSVTIVRSPPSTPGIAGELCNNFEQILPNYGVNEVHVLYVTYKLDDGEEWDDSVIANFTSVGDWIVRFNSDAWLDCSLAISSFNFIVNHTQSLGFTPKMGMTVKGNGWTNDTSRDYWISIPDVCIAF